MKQIGSIFAAVALVLTSITPSSAADSTWRLQDQAETGYSLVNIEENSFGFASRHASYKKSDGKLVSVMCFEGFYNTEGCDPSKANIQTFATNNLGVCAPQLIENCIESLEISNPAGELVPATFIKYAGGPSLPAETKSGLIKSETTSLWEVPGVPNVAGTNTYAVTIQTWNRFDRATKKFIPSEIVGRVNPYLEITGPQYKLPSFSISKLSNGDLALGMRDGGGDAGCAWVLENVCGLALDFTQDAQVKLVARVSNQLSGWFKGRLNDPQFKLSKLSSTNVKLTIQGKPADVPRFAAKEKDAYFTPELIKKIRHWGSAGVTGPKGHSFVYGLPGPTEPNAALWLETFRKNVNDSSSGTSRLWNFGSVDNGGGSPCLRDPSRVLGIVSTNATVYNDSAPKFEEGFLTYSVSGLHYQPDGKALNLGTYDFIMRSDVARCLYGFGNFPISATISVVTDKGVKTTATTVVSEKDGWLKLRAAGFTFSKKTIKVKITKKKK